MKFLVLGKPREDIALSPEVIISIADSSRKWIAEKMLDGKVDFDYPMPGGGALAIVTADSRKDLDAMLSQYPEFKFLTWEIKSLSDADLS